MVYRSKSLQATADIAGEVLARLQDVNVLALIGDLGSGKTAFVQALGKLLGIKQWIVSPTFILMRSYKIPANLAESKAPFGYLYHLDLYRLGGWEDIKALDVNEIWSEDKNLVCIEWGERIADHLPKNHLEIRFEYLSETQRKITVNRRP